MALDEIDVKIEDTDVVRLHRSSKPKKNKDGVTCAQTLLKLGNWKARERLAVANKNARAKRKDIRVHNDLTQRRFQLLKYARDRTERAMARRYPNRDMRNNLRPEKKVYVFANIQSDLKFKIGQRTLAFNTYEDFDAMYEEEFKDIHSSLSGPSSRGFEASPSAVPSSRNFDESLRGRKRRGRQQGRSLGRGQRRGSSLSPIGEQEGTI